MQSWTAEQLRIKVCQIRVLEVYLSVPPYFYFVMETPQKRHSMLAIAQQNWKKDGHNTKKTKSQNPLNTQPSDPNSDTVIKLKVPHKPTAIHG